MHIMEVVEDVEKIIKDLQVFGEKADHANKLITMNKNILENINLTDKFHQLHESSIEVKLNKEEEEEIKHEHSHYHHGPSATTTEREATRVILNLLTDSTNFDFRTEASTLQSFHPDTTSQSPESDTLEPSESTEIDLELVLQSNKNGSEGLSLLETMLIGNLNGSDLISTTCSSSITTSGVTVYIVFGIVLVITVLLLLLLWLFLTRWRKGGKKASHRTMQRAQRPSRGAESFL